MARGIHRLTFLQVTKAARKGLTLCDGGGLYLQNGSSWIFRYTKHHRSHWLGLGPLELVDLTAAREAARSCRKQLFEGLDPLASRRTKQAAARRSISFDACCAAYLAAHGAGWKNPKHQRQWQTTLATYAAPVLGALPVAAIDVSLVLRVIEPLWRKKPTTAARLRGRIERVLGWATVKGYRDDTPNPARWANNLDHLLPAKGAVHKITHHAALPYAEIPDFLGELRRQPGVAARALEFIVYTAVRTGDIIGQGRDDAPPMLWAHVDLERHLWTIPRTKNGTEHRVPLSDPALAVLEAMRPFGSDIVFPGRRRDQPLSDSAMRHVLRCMGRDDVSVHGARSSFKTWAAEQTAFPHDVIEAALTHVIGSRLEAAYRRGDFLEKRARLMNAWADFCTGTPVGKVVSLR